MTKHEITPMRWTRPVLAALLAVAPACGGDQPVEAETEELPPSQGPSEPCNPEHGIDACGAGLFCAAFDGRKVHTCYANGSRLRGEACDDDDNCVTGNCTSDLCGGAPVGAFCVIDSDCDSGDCGLGNSCLEP
jgi:hypothetical protein